MFLRFLAISVIAHTFFVYALVSVYSKKKDHAKDSLTIQQISISSFTNKKLNNETYISKRIKHKENLTHESEINKTNISGENFSTNLKIANENISKSILANTVISEYLSKVKTFIQENIVYPSTLRKYNLTGLATLEFEVTSNGKIQNIKLLKSSGKNIIDETAIEELSKIENIPAFPDIFKDKNKIKMELPINFRIN